MALKLPKATDTVVARTNQALENEDLKNRKKGTDLDLHGDRLIISSPNGTRFQVIVNDAGVITAAPAVVSGNAIPNMVAATGFFTLTGKATLNGLVIPTPAIPNASVVPYTPGFTGGVLTTVAVALDRGAVNVLDFGADNTGANATATTAAIQAAIATGKPVYCPAGIYLLNSPLNLTTPGQLIFGDGMTEVTTFKVDATFSGIGVGAPLAGTNGVFKLNSSEPGPHLRDICIVGAQPNNVTTSSTSNTVGTGSKTFTVPAGLGYLTAGASLHIFDTGTPGNFMEGGVTSYSGTTLVANITGISGSGTFSTWTINAASLANLNQYPPAIWCAFANATTSQARFVLERVKIYGFPTGIDMRGNNGGAYLDTVWLGCLGTNILIDGSLDVVQVDNLRIWPFGLNAAQTVLFTGAGTVGVQAYRCDGLFFNNAMFLCNNQLSFDTSAPSSYSVGGGLFGGAAGSEFDSFNGIVMNDAAVVGGASFTVSDAFFSMETASFISANSAAGNLNISNSIFLCAVDQTALAASGGVLNATGNTFACGNFVRSNPVINVTGATAILGFNGPTGPTTSGVFVATAVGLQFHRIGFTGKNTGWTNSLGANANAVYADN